MRMKPTKGQRWRVSVYGLGVMENLPRGFPMEHKASRKREIADSHFARFAALIGGGKVGRVILHQGKLYMGDSQYIENDTRWWPDRYPQNAEAHASATKEPIA